MTPQLMWRSSDQPYISSHTVSTKQYIPEVPYLTEMHIQALVSVLVLGSTSFAAQLTQVSNYGGSARAKPGMFVSFTWSQQTHADIDAGGCMFQIR